jgi:hypothetical protein
MYRYGKTGPDAISPPVTRSLPAEVAKPGNCLPYKVAAGHLFLEQSFHRTPCKHLWKSSSLEMRFHLVTPEEFEELAEEYLPQ